MKPYDLRAPVTDNLDLGRGFFLTSLRAPEIARIARPGQFVMLGTIDPAELLLRRPFSVALTRASAGAGGEPDEIRLLYRVVGRGTSLFSKLAVGSELAVLGPLGNGFSETARGERPILVAGGIGIAAFPFLIERMRDGGLAPVLCYGGRTAADLTMLDWLRERCEVVVTTDDGSAGEKGLVTASLEPRLDRRDASRGEPKIYSCGPEPMLRAVAGIAERRGVASEAALEALMACGFGVCLGCVVEAREPRGEYGRFVRVCCEGPVFPTSEIRW